MTDLSGLAQAIAILGTAYPRQDFPEETAVFYTKALGDLPDVEVVAAVRSLIETSVFLPSIAEIRRAVAEAALDAPRTEEAWRMVNDARTANLLPDVVSAAMEDVGGRYAIRTSERPEIVRAQFFKCYENRVEQALLEVMVSATGKQLETARPPLRVVPEIPETTSMPPSVLLERVWTRAQRNAAGDLGRDAEMPPASDEEKREAIRILQLGEPAEGETVGYLLWVEAHRILDEDTKGPGWQTACDHDGWVAGCVYCERESLAANAWIERAERGETKS